MLLINVARLLFGAKFGTTKVMSLFSQCRFLPQCPYATISLLSFNTQHTWRIANRHESRDFPSLYVTFEAHNDTLGTEHLHRQEGIQRSGQNVGLVGSPLN